MNIIFELNHPKHYYQFKYIMHNLQANGHKCLVLARDKDVLLNVLDEEGVPYKIFGLHHKSMMKKVVGTISIINQYRKIASKFKADVIVSKASFYGCFVAKLLGAKSIIFPDSEVVKVTNKYVVPMCTKVVTPDNFTLNYGEKHMKVKGLFENSYLAPNVFSPKNEIIESCDLKKPYAVFRFVGWYANHDVGNAGLSLEDKVKLVKSVEKYMSVYISSEKELPAELSKYKLNTPSSEIHTVLKNADLYLGDSQTMATEAAILGTPAIRTNSFVGHNDMSNFILLENKYKLLVNVPINDYNLLFNTVTEFAQNSRKEEWTGRLSAYYEEVGDMNKDITKIIETLCLSY